MENKKQLIIVPPMSGPFQKLNEVLQGIAVDENIEITTIDDPKELVQFISSVGQSLIAFSDIKKCATFLQDNKILFIKNRSKVILLTAKEIPPKTLVKLVKIGLTESILENSPPKTLLYKVKLLLRSIKSTSLDDKDQVVKSIQQNKIQRTKSELDIDKEQSEQNNVNNLAEEREKFKENQTEDSNDYGDNLKGKISPQEEPIETHWKSKLIAQEELVENETDAHKITDDESAEIDMYYRGKNQRKTEDVEDTEENDLNDIENTEEVSHLASKKKRSQETELNEEDVASKDREKHLEKTQENLALKTNHEDLSLEAIDKKKKHNDTTEIENKKKDYKLELDKLDALFADALKRQAQQSEDLGGNLKGKIKNHSEENETDEEPEIDDKKEYDNSELYKRKKLLQLDLEAGVKEKNDSSETGETGEESNAPHEGEVDKINDNMIGKNSSAENINEQMMGKLSEDNSKKIRSMDVFNIDPKKNNESSENENSDENNNKLNQAEKEETEPTNIRSEAEENTTAEKEKSGHPKQDDNLTNDKIQKNIIEDIEKNKNKRNSIQLNLNDIEEDAAKSNEEAVNSDLTFRKLNQSDNELEKNKDEKSNHGKVDKIDTHYRSRASQNQEHSWDNLTDAREANLQLEKNKRSEDQISGPNQAKDNGENTIDYRKLKEEFSQISRAEQSSDKNSLKQDQLQVLLDTEDEGRFKVVELDARGFDFGINIVNLIYKKESKPKEFYQIIAEELISKYKAYPVFYTYNASEKKHTESFDSFFNLVEGLVSNELKEWWQNTKTQEEILTDYFSKSMATWLCREIEDKAGNGKYWEDVELPQWAMNELTTKKVELIFPYFEGVDRMGLAFVFFPEGINPRMEKGLTVTLEMARTILLDGIKRSIPQVNRNISNESAPQEKKNVLSIFSGIFKSNKAN